MIVLDVAYGTKQGRLFVSGPSLPDAATIAAHADKYMDDEDAAREVLLRDALSRPLVEATIHPGVDPEDVSQVYLTSSSGPLFACTMISNSRLKRTLEGSGLVFEDFCLQVVAPGGSIEAALGVWVQRNFPDLVSPVFSLEPWGNDASIELALEPLELEGLAAPTGTLPESIEPDLAQLGITDEAA